MSEMNECQNLQQQLDEYLSNHLSDFAKHRIDNHLRQCSICAKEVNGYKMVIGELRSLAKSVNIEPSLSLEYSLKRITQPNPTQELFTSSNYNVLILSGTLLFALGTIFGLLNYYGAVSSSLLISFISALLGSVVLATGLIQMRRKTKSSK